MCVTAEDVIRRILSAHPKKTVNDPSLTPAGVMLLIYRKNGEHCVLLNRRTDQVEHHKGEISFPGGRRDENDATLLETALRETEEEMGLRREDIEPLGDLDDIPTSSKFLISTYVGTIEYPYHFKPNDSEVAEVLEIPLSALMDPKNVRDEVRIVDQHLVNSPAYAYDGHLIFGATARVLRRFLELLGTAPEKEALWRKEQ